MERPSHLLDFTDPPLNEVVLGVQFAPVSNYTSAHSRNVWDLFKEEFPVVQEQPLFPPKFETFGGGNPQPIVQFSVGPPPLGSRLWFLSQDKSHLLQFQPDRFLINWRKQRNSQEYPRFERIAKSFDSQLRKLEQHLRRDFSYELDINQAEVTYVNIVPVAEFSDASDWFNIWGVDHFPIEALNANFNEVINNDERKPFARLIYAIQSAVVSDGKQKAFRLSLTFRGKPDGQSAGAGMKFIELGRNRIVTRFGEITTKMAHEKWGRQL